VPAADCIYFPRIVFPQHQHSLVVAVSRSGDTTETVNACAAAQAQGSKTLAITCYPESRLAEMADFALILEAANEKAVVTTQSLTSMILCGQELAALVSGRQDYLKQLQNLPVIGNEVLAKTYQTGRKLGQNPAISRFAFVGNGPYYGLARECQLKIKEMTLLPSDSYPVLEFRHGPKSNVNGQMLVTLLLSDAAREAEVEFLEEMKALGGLTLVICDQADMQLSNLADTVVELDSRLPDFARDILYMPVVHFLAYYRSLLEGQDPDYPANLDYAVILKDGV
jgi:glucosamine--fructose-6-phosphate aminotransferase (isomerizing)